MSYHQGERAVQRRAGLSAAADRVRAVIRTDIPPAATQFLATQPLIVVGSRDESGRAWVTLLTGPPGFIQTGRSSTGHTVTVHTRPIREDPLAPVLARPAHVGAIAIDQATRRRMRINGRARPLDGGFIIDVDQIIANCPQYIQARTSTTVDARPGPARHTSHLTEGQLGLIKETSTFFIATSDADGNFDASHRGGRPGFLTAPDPTTVSFPDYPGNAMFLTLGNIVVNPRVGLLIPDWHDGTTVQVTGAARVLWEPDVGPGAQRRVRVDVTDVVEIPNGSPLRWSPPEYSRFNP